MKLIWLQCCLTSTVNKSCSVDYWYIKKNLNVTKANTSCMAVTIQVPKGFTVPGLRWHLIHSESFGVVTADYKDSRETKTKW